MNTALALALLQVLIVIHELGHYGFARLFGMKISRFSVGFGPRLLGFHRAGTEFVLSAVPFGGYVQIDGMSTQDEIDRNDPAAYFNKPMWQRFVVVLMGPVANVVLAFAAFAVMFAVGYDKPVYNRAVIGAVRAELPAARAGLQAGDQLTRIGQVAISTFEDIPTAIADTQGEVEVAFQREGTEHVVRLDPDVRPEPTLMRRLFRLDKPTRILGIEAPVEHVPGVGPIAALGQGLSTTVDRTGATLAAFANLVSGQAKGRLTGLPGIVKMIGGSIERGAGAVLALLAILSINLFLFNLFPIPALDGGRLIFLGLEGVRRKPLDSRLENIVHAAGFILLLSLILFVSLRDLFV